MKSSTKKKEDVKESKKTSLKTKIADKSLSPEDQKILSLWEEEVKAVLDTKYSSLDEAVNAIIKGVVKRMETDATARERTREFLYEFMTADPAVVNEIKAIFNLK